MIELVERQKALEEFKVFPLRGYDGNGKEELFYPAVYRSYVLTSSLKPFSKQIRLLGTEVARLAAKLAMDELFFLGDTEIAWLYQENDYKPVREARAFFVSNKIGKRFNGALQVDTISLPSFIWNISWFIRCNGALPDIYFTGKGQDILGSVCKYGNLHIDLFNKEIAGLFRTLLPESRLMCLNGNCYCKGVGEGKAIRGRRTIP
jgi:hypothetical protein